MGTGESFGSFGRFGGRGGGGGIGFSCHSLGAGPTCPQTVQTVPGTWLCEGGNAHERVWWDQWNNVDKWNYAESDRTRMDKDYRLTALRVGWGISSLGQASYWKSLHHSDFSDTSPEVAEQLPPLSVMSGSATTKSDNGPERMLSKSPGVITASFTDDEETPNTQQFFLPSCERHGSIQRSCFMHVEEHIEDVQDVLRRDPCVSTPDITHADIAAKHTNFRVPEHGLITRGDEDTGERLVGPYTEALADEYRVQSGRMIGHMTGSLPAWGRPVADLLNFYHLNNVKIETGKVTTAIEKETIAMMHHTLFGRGDDFYAEYVQGLSSCLGHPTSGGTVANLEALWVARNHAWALGEKFGLPAVTAAEASATANRVKYDSTQSTPCAGVIVCSTLTHYSISKAVGVLGLGTNNVVTVPTNGQLKMDIRALAATLARLAAARTRVIAIVAIAGTTEAGTFDELRPIGAPPPFTSPRHAPRDAVLVPCARALNRRVHARAAELAKKHRAWLHVDAAWGGGHIFGSKQLLAGVDLADSITIDAHKNLFSTIGFGMVLFKEPTSVGAIEKAAQYIIRHGSADIGRYCLEGTRPAVALQLRASLDALGRDGLRATFDRKLAVAKHFAAAVKAAGDLELVLEPGACP